MSLRNEPAGEDRTSRFSKQCIVCSCNEVSMLALVRPAKPEGFVVPKREECGGLSDTRSNTCVQKVVCLALDRTTKG